MRGGNWGGEGITCSGKLKDRVEKVRSSSIGRMVVEEAIVAWDSRRGLVLRETQDFGREWRVLVRCVHG